MNGLYAFRFSGFAMERDGVPSHLVGVGLMTLFPDGTLKGSQASSVTRLQGPEPMLIKARFTLSGTYSLPTSAIGQASIDFESVFPRQTLHGEFSVVRAAVDRFWMISTGAVVGSSKRTVADEVVSGEAVWIGAAAEAGGSAAGSPGEP